MRSFQCAGVQEHSSPCGSASTAPLGKAANFDAEPVPGLTHFPTVGPHVGFRCSLTVALTPFAGTLSAGRL